MIQEIKIVIQEILVIITAIYCLLHILTINQSREAERRKQRQQRQSTDYLLNTRANLLNTNANLLKTHEEPNNLCAPELKITTDIVCNDSEIKDENEKKIPADFSITFEITRKSHTETYSTTFRDSIRLNSFQKVSYLEDLKTQEIYELYSKIVEGMIKNQQYLQPEENQGNYIFKFETQKYVTPFHFEIPKYSFKKSIDFSGLEGTEIQDLIKSLYEEIQILKKTSGIHIYNVSRNDFKNSKYFEGSVLDIPLAKSELRDKKMLKKIFADARFQKRQDTYKNYSNFKLYQMNSDLWHIYLDGNVTQYKQDEYNENEPIFSDTSGNQYHVYYNEFSLNYQENNIKLTTTNEGYFINGYVFFRPKIRNMKDISNILKMKELIFGVVKEDLTAAESDIFTIGIYVSGAPKNTMVFMYCKIVIKNSVLFLENIGVYYDKKHVQGYGNIGLKKKMGLIHYTHSVHLVYDEKRGYGDGKIKFTNRSLYFI